MVAKFLCRGEQNKLFTDCMHINLYIIFSLVLAFTVTFSIRSVYPSVDLCLSLLELWILNHLSWNFYNTKVPRSWVKVERANMSCFPSFCIWLYSKLDWKVKAISMSGSSLRLFIVNIIYLGQVNQHKNIFPSILNAFVIFLYFVYFLAKRRSCLDLCFIWEKLKFFHCKMFFIMLKLTNYSKKIHVTFSRVKTLWSGRILWRARIRATSLSCKADKNIQHFLS